MTKVTKQRMVACLLCLSVASLFIAPAALNESCKSDSSIGAKGVLASRYPLRQRTNNFFDRSKASKAKR